MSSYYDNPSFMPDRTQHARPHRDRQQDQDEEQYHHQWRQQRKQWGPQERWGQRRSPDQRKQMGPREQWGQRRSPERREQREHSQQNEQWGQRRYPERREQREPSQRREQGEPREQWGQREPSERGKQWGPREQWSQKREERKSPDRWKQREHSERREIKPPEQWEQRAPPESSSPDGQAVRQPQAPRNVRNPPSRWDRIRRNSKFSEVGIEMEERRHGRSRLSPSQSEGEGWRRWTTGDAEDLQQRQKAWGDNGDIYDGRRYNSDQGWDLVYATLRRPDASLAQFLPSRMEGAAGGTLRFRGDRRRVSQRPRQSTGEATTTTAIKEELMTGDKAQAELARVRELPMSISRRRQYRQELKAIIQSEMGAAWFEGARPVTDFVSRGGSKLKNYTSGLRIWDRPFKKIEGRFGMSVVAVFNFIRTLVKLDLVFSMVLLGAVVVPAALWQAPQQYGGWHVYNQSDNLCQDIYLDMDNSESMVFQCSKDYVSSINTGHHVDFIELVRDFIQGSGFLENTLLFAGFYSPKLGADGFKMYMAYPITMLVVYAVSLLHVVYFLSRWLRTNVTTTASVGLVYSNIAFAGWDFGITESEAAKTEERLIATEVRVAIEEERFQERKAGRSQKNLVILYLTRGIVNLFVVSLLGGGWAAIYFVVKATDDKGTDDFLREYAPTVTVAVLNFILPNVFSRIVALEGYSGRVELILTLFRSALVRLTSLGVLLISQISIFATGVSEKDCSPTKETMCWETHLGKQIYSLLILDAVTKIGVTFVVNVARRLLRDVKFAFCRIIGMIEFDVPTHVLDIIYTQTLLWLGTFFSPLIPVIAVLILILHFGLKMFAAFFTCVPATKVFRASRSSYMFMAVLTVAYMLSIIAIGVSLLWLQPSRGCGAFRGLRIAWDAVVFSMCGEAEWFRSLLFIMDSAVFALPILVILVFLLVYYVSLYKAKITTIKYLEEQLKHTTRDKVFLMNTYARLRQNRG
ncbi:transmembrane channel-like protein 7 [Oratosquilla oratoria]|uniref:transmembrane channel-like protein 7 n=1 Tax=Oratosquilla oratoria TaxID=337810 RepID=UPI003F759F8F